MRYLTIVLLSACAGDFAPQDLEAETPAAVEVVVGEWSARLGVDLSGEERPPVTWHPERCLAPPPGVQDPPDCIIGYYHRGTPGEIHLATPEWPRISLSALAHELLHWSLVHARGDSDGDHGDPEWCLVDEVNDELER